MVPYSPLRKALISVLALDTVGIFREPGSKVEIAELVSKINALEDIKFGQKVKNFFTVADMIKLYLRQLKEPLITTDLFESFKGTVSGGNLLNCT